MANKLVKLLLNAAQFPFLSLHQSNSLTEPSDLAPRMPGTFYGSRENADYSVPQLIYCENVLPFAKGLYSVGFSSIAPAISFIRSFPAGEAMMVLIR